MEVRGDKGGGGGVLMYLLVFIGHSELIVVICNKIGIIHEFWGVMGIVSSSDPECLPCYVWDSASRVGLSVLYRILYICVILLKDIYISDPNTEIIDKGSYKLSK